MKRKSVLKPLPADAEEDARLRAEIAAIMKMLQPLYDARRVIKDRSYAVYEAKHLKRQAEAEAERQAYKAKEKAELEAKIGTGIEKLELWAASGDALPHRDDVYDAIVSCIRKADKHPLMPTVLRYLQETKMHFYLKDLTTDELAGYQAYVAQHGLHINVHHRH